VTHFLGYYDDERQAALVALAWREVHAPDRIEDPELLALATRRVATSEPDRSTEPG